jgi:release factor glutamine methyltransferase
MSLRLSLAAAESVLAGGPHPERARRDAETLLVHVLRMNVPDINLAWLIAHESESLAPDSAATFRELTNRRLAGEPIQYIVGKAEFYGLPFYVNRDVLIPRPETEHLVEKAIELARKLKEPGAIPERHYPHLHLVTDLRIVDVGTGSGAIAVALADALRSARITAIDISAAALKTARANAARNGAGNIRFGNIRFIEGDLLRPVAGEQFEIVVSNPPYVPESDREGLSAEVREFEPAQALFAGEDGLAIYRRLIPAAFDALVPGGFVLLEIGYGQREAIRSLLAGAGFRGIEFFDDLQKIPRVVIARRL